MDEATYTSLFLISAEVLYLRHYQYDDFDDFRRQSFTVFVGFYFICLAFTISYIILLKKSSICKSATVKEFIPWLYILDSFSAIGVGWGLYHKDFVVLLVSAIALTNFFMLNIITSVFVAKKTEGWSQSITAMTKNYIHHMSSFFFLSVEHKEVIVITTCWRALSMSGHLAQTLQKKGIITPEGLYNFNWKLSHCRNLFVLYIILVFFCFEEIREGFAESAVGHVGYILVRAGPVFRLGSCYVGDRVLWQGFTDSQRLATLSKGMHPFLTIEVGSLLILAVLLLTYRILDD